MQNEPVSKVFVVERFQGRVVRAHYECEECQGDTDREASFCPTCGRPFRAGAVERQVTR